MTTKTPSHPGESNQKHGNERPSNGFAIPPEHRTRVLIFACAAAEAYAAARFSDDMESIYLPSYDTDEVHKEIEHLAPRFLFCGVDFLLDFYPAHGPAFAGRGLHMKNQELLTLDAPMPALTRREMKILTMLVKGSTNDEIAHALQLSARTVKRILSMLFERLEVTNRTELTGRVGELHLLRGAD